jgi:hypothetical protein
MCQYHVERLTTGDHVGHRMLVVSDPRKSVSPLHTKSWPCDTNHILILGFSNNQAVSGSVRIESDLTVARYAA